MAKCQWRPPKEIPGSKEYPGCSYECQPTHNFCIFHSPLSAKQKDYELVLKFGAAFDALFDDKALKDQEGDFKGFIFPDKFDLSGLDFRRSYERLGNKKTEPDTHIPVDFSWAVFGDGVKFRDSKFGTNARFERSRFLSSPCFDRATFESWANFSNAIFGDAAIFIEAVFGIFANFRGVTFGDGARFDRAVFGDSAAFEHVKFGNSVSFEEVKFGEEVLFTESTFDSATSFRDTTFGNGSNFNGVRFKDSSELTRAKFGKHAQFEGVIFGNSANFNRAVFGDSASFWQAEFGNVSNFRYAKFGDETIFYGASFGDNTNFNRSSFGLSSSFQEVVFGDYVSFRKTFFAHSTDFIGVKFGDHVSFWETQFDDSISFRSAKFGENTRFENACFKGSVDFRRIIGREITLHSRARQVKQSEGREEYLIRGELFRQVPPDLVFRRTQFLGIANFQENDLSRVRFQQVDLRYLSFIDSQISQTKFVSCHWGTGLENRRYARWELQRRVALRRPRLLLDELIYRDIQIEQRDNEQEDKLSINRLKRKTKHVDLLIELFSRFVDIVLLLYNLIKFHLWKTNYDEKIRKFRKVHKIEIKPSDIELLGLQLKQSLDTTKDPIAAGDFHFAVMEMKRAQAMEVKHLRRIDEDGIEKEEVTKKRRGRALMLWLYKWTNGYGERYGRTALWLAMLIGIFSFVYFQMNGLEATVDIKNVVNINKHVPDLGFWKRVWFSIAFAFQNVLPFKLYSNYLCAVGPNLHWVRGLAMGETLVGTTLFTFFALALRRRFKR